MIPGAGLVIPGIGLLFPGTGLLIPWIGSLIPGAESLIPALEAIMEKGAELGTVEFVIGMPHRGRLNVLANVLRKPYMDIFSEFEGKE